MTTEADKERDWREYELARWGMHMWIAFAAAAATRPNYTAKKTADFADELLLEWRKRRDAVDAKRP